MKEIGINYCGLSNNHVFDFGIKGITDTFDNLDRAGIKYTGFGTDYQDSRKNLVVEKDGEKICFIAVCEHEYSYALEDRMGSRPYDEYETIEDIRKAKEENDRVIVLYHGGKEHCQYPSPRLYRLCHAMARNGADVVICQHSHCIGCYEEYNGCHILYGQGNFHFVKHYDDLPSWDTCLTVHYNTKTHDISFTPIRMLEKGISLAKGEDKETILKEFENRNAQLINGEWKQGWKEFCESKRGQYTRVIGKAGKDDSTYDNNHMFAHYLDCEAHSDVWRELFQTTNMTNEK